jgi:hypothetical protein
MSAKKACRTVDDLLRVEAVGVRDKLAHGDVAGDNVASVSPKERAVRGRGVAG